MAKASERYLRLQYIENYCRMAKASERYRLAVVGAGGVGKSSLTVQFIQGHFIVDYDPTVEDYYSKVCTVDKEKAYLEILDTAGQEEYQTMREQYMEIGEGFLLLYSIDDRQSFNEVQEYRNHTLRVKDVDQYPMLLIGNKCDLSTEQRKISTQEGQELAKYMGCEFIETSAKMSINVKEAFHLVVRQIRCYREEMIKKTNYDRKHLGNKKNSQCCVLL